MNKSDKELAVDLVIAQIQAASVLKQNQLQTGVTLKGDIVCQLIEQYYKKLASLDNNE